MQKENQNIENLPQILSFASHAFAKKTAIVFGKKQIDYLDLYKITNSASIALKKWGVKKQDRVAILLDNSPEFIFCYFAILTAGGVVVPLNHMFKRDEIKYILEDSQSKYLITSSTYAGICEELNTIVNSLKQIIYTNYKNSNALSLIEYLNEAPRAKARGFSKRNTERPLFIRTLKGAVFWPRMYKPISQNEENIVNGKKEEAIKKDDVAVFLYTSGTTGHPKAAMLTHGNLLANISSSSRAINITQRDTFLCFLPLFHSFAATVCMLMPLFNGAKIVIMKSPRPVRKLLRTIRNNKVTIFSGIPSIYNILNEVKFPKFLPLFLIKFFNPIHLAISGAAALPAEVFSKFERKFGIPLLEGYGLTEASPVVSLNPLKSQRKPGSIGLPIPDVSVKIIDDNGKEVSGGEIGELCVKGPNVMLGYFNKEQDNRDTIKDGWLLTGDMARLDEEGYIYIMGRKKDMVNVRGLNVYPREIEEVLYQNPNIKEAAVIGVPDLHKGEIPKGYVVLKNKDSMTEHDIISFLKERIALYKVPRTIEIRNELPKNSTGKILKRLLVEENLKNTSGTHPA